MREEENQILSVPTSNLAAKTIWIAGASGMVGKALVKRLADENPASLLTPNSSELDLRNQTQTFDWVRDNKPNIVILAAAKVGGIYANAAYPAEFVYDNLTIAANVIEASHRVGVEKLLYLGSSCIYPKFAPQPIPEDALLTGPLEPTNEAYAIAKIAGIHLCQSYRDQYGSDFIAAMPCNLYGPGDRYHDKNSHVIPALIQRAHTAKLSGAPKLSIWGTGTPLREFLYVDDAADALIHVLKHWSQRAIINIGSGIETTIANLAQAVVETVEYEGELIFDKAKPDGTPRKVMDSSRLNRLGWSPKIDLKTGLQRTYTDYLNQL